MKPYYGGLVFRRVGEHSVSILALKIVTTGNYEKHRLGGVILSVLSIEPEV